MSYEVLNILERKSPGFEFKAFRWGANDLWFLVHPFEASRWVTDGVLRRSYEIAPSVESKSKVQLGKIYKDTVTNFTGTVTALAQYLKGCGLAQLTPRGSAGTLHPSTWTVSANLEEVL